MLTNNHVIEDASAIHLKLSDGRTVRNCEVVGVDQLTDLAVLKIDLEGLAAAPWGDSDALEVGDWVLAVGNPFGLDRSVTAGIVSAKERRNVVSSLPYQDFLQTDAAVNPGNSGGPLVNLQGEVVGINTAIVGDAFQGISFAIPSSIAREVYDRLKTTGKASHGWLGVGLNPLNEDLAEQLGAEGVLITNVFSDSPADQRRPAAGGYCAVMERTGRARADGLEHSRGPHGGRGEGQGRGLTGGRGAGVQRGGRRASRVSAAVDSNPKCKRGNTRFNNEDAFPRLRCGLACSQAIDSNAFAASICATAIDPFLRHYYIRGFRRRLRFGTIGNLAQFAEFG